MREGREKGGEEGGAKRNGHEEGGARAGGGVCDLAIQIVKLHDNYAAARITIPSSPPPLLSLLAYSVTLFRPPPPSPTHQSVTQSLTLVGPIITNETPMRNMPNAISSRMRDTLFIRSTHSPQGMEESMYVTPDMRNTCSKRTSERVCVIACARLRVRVSECAL
jgi:hypothetical protein